ncbi:MAG TPA: type VI secretion system baseplate subunit TssK, partial [Burkholderiaceae bacterium]
TADLYTDAAAADLAYLKKSVRLVPASHARDGCVGVPVVRLRKTADGAFELDASFVPPSVSLGASPPLLTALSQLQEALAAKLHMLRAHHREPTRDSVEFRSGDVASFWLLHTVSSAHAQLGHYLRNAGLHPERLFEQLLHLAGALMTYSPRHTHGDLPAYTHDDPGTAFGALDALIRQLLDTVISSRCQILPLAEARPSYFHVHLHGALLSERAALYLAVRADMAPLELVEAVPLRFKMGAPDNVEKHVLSAMPGVRLHHVTQVPAAIPIRPGAHYFALECKGELFEAMTKSQSACVYVPAGIAGVGIDLLVLAP